MASKRFSACASSVGDMVNQQIMTGMPGATDGSRSSAIAGTV